MMKGGHEKLPLEVAITFKARAGGVPRSQVTLANAFLEQGVKPSLVLPSTRGRTLEGLSPAVELVDLNASGIPRFAMRFARYLKRKAPAAVLASGHLSGLSVALAASLASYGGAVVLLLHNDPGSALQHSRWRWLTRRLIRSRLTRIDAAVAVSSGVAEDLARILPKLRGRIHVILNAVPLESVRAQALERCAPDPWLDDRDDALFVAAGRLVPQKDFPTAIRAFALCRRRVRSRMVILGDGEERPSLEALIHELGLEASVRILGYQTNPYRIMVQADAVISSSRWEGFGMVLLEALALGIPVVSTDCRSGPAEVLDHGRFGELVPVGDSEALAAAMARAAVGAGPGDAAARVRRAAEFSPAEAAHRYLELLRGLSRDRPTLKPPRRPRRDVGSPRPFGPAESTPGPGDG